MARFSNLVVPDGNVPSTGKADTGSRSPSPAIRTAVTDLTKSGASAGTTGGSAWPVVVGPSVTWPRRAIDASMAAKF